MLGVSNPGVAEKTGLQRNTLNRLDKGEAKASTVRLALEPQAVQFLEAGRSRQGRAEGVGLLMPPSYQAGFTR